jgi:predicted flap endonuclease-1-like 5' DNA nuclease
MRKLTALQWIIILLAFATALIHIFLGVSSWGTNSTMGAIFVLDGIGYIVIVSLLYFSGRTGRGRSTMRWILIAYTLLTIILYFVFNGSTAFSSPLGLITKAIEAILIILLLLDRGSDTVEVASPTAVGTSVTTRTVTAVEAATTSAGTSIGGAAAVAAAAVVAAEDRAEFALDVDADVDGARLVTVGDTSDVAAGTRAGVDLGAAGGLSREALNNFFGDIDSLTTEEWRAKLMGHLALLGGTSQFEEPIEFVEGIGDVRGRKWRAVNITKTGDLLVFGATRKGRAALAKRSGFGESEILTWANQVDLYRIVGVGKQYADLLEQAGVDTIVELAGRNAQNLQKRMVEVNNQRKLVGRTPTLSEVEKWVEQAATLPRIMHY